MKTSKALIENNKYIIQNYQRYPIEIIRGDGSFIWDSKGKKYLDFISGIAVNNLGHNNSKINKAISSIRDTEDKFKDLDKALKKQFPSDSRNAPIYLSFNNQHKEFLEKVVIKLIKGIKNFNFMDVNIQNEITRELYS